MHIRGMPMRLTLGYKGVVIILGMLAMTIACTSAPSSRSAEHDGASTQTARQGAGGTTSAVNDVPAAAKTEEEPPFVAPKGVTLYEEVEIGKAGNRPMHASIAVPETPPDAPMPVMVYIHGGGWNHGDRKGALGSICGYVTKRGYIGVSLDYRLTPEAPFPAQLQDVKLAIRYLRAHAKQYHIDPSRIGVWGVSAGGHLAALLGTTGDLASANRGLMSGGGDKANAIDLSGTGGWPDYSEQVQAVADWYGPSDFTTKEADSNKSIAALMGNKRALTVPELARSAMPGTYASPNTPPFWIRHGDADTTVPFTESVKLAQQLKDAGSPVVDFKIVPGQGHGFKGEAAAQASEEAWAFMDQHVKHRIVSEPILYKKK